MNCIGIDPAFRVSGIGFCILVDNVVSFRSYKTNELLNAIINKEFSNCLVSIENSDLQKAKFKLNGLVAFYKQKKYSQARINGLVAEFGARIGKNQATSQIIQDCLQFKCLKIIPISPREKGKKIESDSIIRGIAKTYGWTLGPKRMNQDKRDAFIIMLHAYHKIKTIKKKTI